MHCAALPVCAGPSAGSARLAGPGTLLWPMLVTCGPSPGARPTAGSRGTGCKQGAMGWLVWACVQAGVCIHVCTYAYRCACACTCAGMSMCLGRCVCTCMWMCAGSCAFMCACVWAYMCAHARACVWACVCLCAGVYICVCACMWAGVYMFVCMYVGRYTHACVCVGRCTYVCGQVDTCVYMCVCMEGGRSPVLPQRRRCSEPEPSLPRCSTGKQELRSGSCNISSVAETLQHRMAPRALPQRPSLGTRALGTAGPGWALPPQAHPVLFSVH